MIAFELLTQTVPYTAQNIIDLMQQIQVPIRAPRHVSAQLQEFITGCLRFNEADRISWEEVFSHPLFATQSPLSQDIQNIQHKRTAPVHSQPQKVSYHSRMV